MADKEKQKPSVLIDDVAQTPDFDDRLMEDNLKTIEKESPNLHAVMMKYKNHHATDKETAKED